MNEYKHITTYEYLYNILDKSENFIEMTYQVNSKVTRGSSYFGLLLR